MNTSVITGDIINSRKSPSNNWLPVLREVLSQYGTEPLQWEIYRGDSFQLEVKAEKALFAAIHIKASLKQIKNVDVRMAIGIGEKTYSSEKVTESNGSAFVYSGECFEKLNKNTLAICSSHLDFDQEINLNLSLALLTMDHWGGKSSKIIKTAIENPKSNQNELAQILNRSQSTISQSLKNAGYEEIMRLQNRYQTLVTRL